MTIPLSSVCIFLNVIRDSHNYFIQIAVLDAFVDPEVWSGSIRGFLQWLLPVSGNFFDILLTGSAQNIPDLIPTCVFSS